MFNSKKKYLILGQIKENRFIKFIFIPIFLLVFWFASTVVFNNEISLSVLQYNHAQNNTEPSVNEKLLKGKIIKGEFRSIEDNLGIISFKIENVPNVKFNDEDTIIFRLYDESGELVIENKYRAGLFKSYRYFPFGFPQIDSSKNKIYRFEVESLEGNSVNSLTFNKNSQFISKYQFSKNEILISSESLIKFLKNYLYAFFTNINVLLFSILFFIPFGIYILLLIFPFNKYLLKFNNLKFKNILFVLVLIFIFIDIFILMPQVYGIVIGLICVWCISIYKNKYTNRSTFIFSFILFLILTLNIYLNLGYSSEKLSTYAYLLLVIGFIQTLLEYKNRRK